MGFLREGFELWKERNGLRKERLGPVGRAILAMGRVKGRLGRSNGGLGRAKGRMGRANALVERVGVWKQQVVGRARKEKNFSEVREKKAEKAPFFAPKNDRP